MRIAMVCLPGGDATAHPRRIAELSAALARHGHQVTMYTSRDAAPLIAEWDAADRVDVVYGPPTAQGTNADPELLQDLGAFTLFLEDQWARHTPDLAHAHHWTAGLATQLAAARSQRIPTVQSFHCLDYVHRSARQDMGPPTRRRLEALIARGSSWLIASHTEEMLHLGKMGCRRSRMSLVPCGIDTSLYPSQGPAAPRGTRHRILAVGDIEADRGLDTVIESLRFMPNAELLIAERDGPGQSRDAEASRLTSLASRRGVADRVRFCGEVPDSEVPALLRSADVVACLPRHESFGIVALEAMACGVPVVASAVGGLTDTVVPDVTGRLVAPNNPRECAEAILPILKQPFTRSSLGAAGHDRARFRYAWDRIAFDTGRVYRQVVADALPDVRRDPIVEGSTLATHAINAAG